MNIKKKILRFPLIRAITSVFFVLILTSCASYRTVVPGSTDHLSGALPSIAPGNVIRVNMKNGETITDLKVTAINAETIIGIQRYRDLNNQPRQINKVITVPAIQSIKKRRISPVKTVGLVIVLVSSPLWLWALGGAQL